MLWHRLLQSLDRQQVQYLKGLITKVKGKYVQCKFFEQPPPLSIQPTPPLTHARAEIQNSVSSSVVNTRREISYLHLMFYLLCKHQWITTSFHFNSFCTVKGAIYYVAIATVICSHAKISCFRAKASRVEKYFTRSLHSLEKYVSTREEKFLILCGHVAHICHKH